VTSTRVKVQKEALGLKKFLPKPRPRAKVLDSMKFKGDGSSSSRKHSLREFSHSAEHRVDKENSETIEISD
jgi:hypothetical protein